MKVLRHSAPSGVRFLRTPNSQLCDKAAFQPFSSNSSDHFSAPKALTMTVKDSSASLNGSGKPNTIKPPRKPTYAVRKEEKQSLLRQIDQLQLQQKFLKDVYRKKAQSTLNRKLQRDQIHSTIQAHRHSLANVQAAVSAYTSTQNSLPHENNIQLSANFNQRHAMLMTVKQQAIQSGLAYLSARTQFLDPFRPFTEMTRFQLDSGDYCSLRVDHTPLFAPRTNIRKVFQAAVDSHAHIDMRITDVFDDIVTCDELDYGIEGARQSRFTSRMSSGIGVEMNVVVCHEFIEQNEEQGPVGVFTADFVDHDDLYPYRPSEYVRHDATGVLVIRNHTRKRRNLQTGIEEEENIITVTLSSLFKQHQTDIPLAPGVEHSLRQQLGRWGDTVMASVLEQVQ